MNLKTQTIYALFLLILCVLASCKPRIEKTPKISDDPKMKKEAEATLEYYGETIHFLKGDFDQVKKQAKKLKKPIFLDFYTEWCQPCKWMEDDVFSQDHVSEFFNLNFINYKVDCEGDGMMIGIDYKITTYPTIIYIDPTGKELVRLEGMNAGSTLIRRGREAIDEYESEDTLNTLVPKTIKN